MTEDEKAKLADLTERKELALRRWMNMQCENMARDPDERREQALRYATLEAELREASGAYQGFMLRLEHAARDALA